MIRMTTPDDTEALLAVACASGLFEPHQVDELAGMLTQYFAAESTGHELWLTDDDGGPVGVAFAAPERMTDGTWNLYMIAIHPDRQRQGRGKAMLEYVECMLTERGQRMLLVETSGTDDFDYVRTFYRNSGYSEEARIRDYYAQGIDKIVFRKVIGASAVEDIKAVESYVPRGLDKYHTSSLNGDDLHLTAGLNIHRALQVFFQ